MYMYVREHNVHMKAGSRQQQEGSTKAAKETNKLRPSVPSPLRLRCCLSADPYEVSTRPVHRERSTLVRLHIALYSIQGLVGRHATESASRPLPLSPSRPHARLGVVVAGYAAGENTRSDRGVRCLGMLCSFRQAPIGVYILKVPSYLGRYLGSEYSASASETRS